jgi:hypothetical protein
MATILIEFDQSVVNDELKNFEHFIPVKSDRLDGDTVLQAVITLSSVSIPLIANIIIESIRSRKHIVIKKNGITIKGIDAQNAIKILKELDEDD